MKKNKALITIPIVEPKRSWTSIILIVICIGLLITGMIAKNLYDSTDKIIYFRFFQFSFAFIIIPGFLLTLRQYFVHPFKKIGLLIIYESGVTLKLNDELIELKGITVGNFNINSYWGEGYRNISAGMENYFTYSDSKGFHKYNIFIRNSKTMKILKRCLKNLKVNNDLIYK